MATSDMKLAARTSARTTKPIGSTRNQQSDTQRHQNTFGLFTRGSKIAGEAGLREKGFRQITPVASSIQHLTADIKGLTLEDYIRGRTSSDLQSSQPQLLPRHPKDRSVVRLKQEDAGFCFDQTFEIEEEDQDNYSQNRNDQLAGGFLPNIKRDRRNHHIKHVQTEASEEPFDYSPQHSRPSRLMTSYNEEQFLPIHSLGRDKPQLRRSFYRRQERSKSNSQKQEDAQLTRNRSKEVQELARKCINFKTNTMSDFYRPAGAPINLQEKNIRVDLGYVTKYANKFRLNPVLEYKQRLHRRQLN